MIKNNKNKKHRCKGIIHKKDVETSE